MIGIVHVHIDAKMRKKRHNSSVVLCYANCLDVNIEIKISKAHFVTILGRPFTLSLILKPTAFQKPPVQYLKKLQPGTG